MESPPNDGIADNLTIDGGGVTDGLVLLSIYSPDEDLSIRIKATPSSTVGEVLDLCIKRLFPGHNLRSFPLAFFRRLTDTRGFFLYRNRTLVSYDLKDEDELELLEPATEAVSLKINYTPEGGDEASLSTNRSFVCEYVDEETTVWEVLHAAMCDFFAIEGSSDQNLPLISDHDAVNYALFGGTKSKSEALPMHEDAFILSYGLQNGDTLILRKTAAEQPQGLQACTIVLSNCSAPSHAIAISTQTGVNPGGATNSGSQNATTVQAASNVMMAIRPDIRSYELLKRAIKMFGIRDRHAVGLFAPSIHKWLHEDSSLDSYGLAQNAVIEVREVYQSCRVCLPALPLGTSTQGYEIIQLEDVFKFREGDTTQHLYEVILYNNPHIYDNAEHYFMTSGTAPIGESNASFFSLGVRQVEVESRYQPILVSFKGREEALHVSFGSPTSDVVMAACLRFDRSKRQNYELSVGNASTNKMILKEDVSLLQQGIQCTSTLFLQKKDKDRKGQMRREAPRPVASAPPSNSPLARPQHPLAAALSGGIGATIGQSLSPSISPAHSPSVPSGERNLLSVGGASKGAGDTLMVGEVLVSLKDLPSTLSIGKPGGLYGAERNIWQEPRGSDYVLPSTLVSSECPFKAATLNHLVAYMTNDSESSDPRFMHALLMTYLSFTTPTILLNKLRERYRVPSTVPSSEATKIQFRVCNALKHWLTKHFDDFDHELIQEVTTFVDDELSRNGLSSVINSIRSAILTRACGLKSRQQQSKYLTVYYGSDKPPPAKSFKKVQGKTPSIFDFDEEEVARQLTLREFMYYRDIKVPELLDQSWNKKGAQQRSPNVLAMIEHFNQASLWVAFLILEPTKIKERVARFEYLIKVATFLQQYNNFNLLMAFIAGMNNSSVLRLKWTKAALSKASISALEKLEKSMSTEGSYATYRNTLKLANPPCIPYIGVHLSDLIFIEDGNPDEVQGLINWEKRVLVFRVIEMIGNYQSLKYNLSYVMAVAAHTEKLEAPPEKELYAMSTSREPRGALKNQIQ